MPTESILTRASRPADLPAIHDVHMAAFGPSEAPRIIRLVDEALSVPGSGRVLSLVAESEGLIVGHVLFTPATVETAGEPFTASILAPLAVHPDVQRQGIGARLIAAGFEALRDSGAELVFVLGDPAYYSRSGFEPATKRLVSPYPLPPAYADAWMVYALRPDCTDHIQGRVRCSPVLDHAELWGE